MTENQILSQVGDAVTQKIKTVTIEIKPRNWFEKLLNKKGFFKSKYEFEISPIVVGSRLRVSSRSLLIPDILFDDDYDVTKVMRAIHNHTDDQIYIVGICIMNNDKEPPKSLLKLLRRVPEDKFYELMDTSLTMLGIKSFMKSMILIKGSNVITAKEKDVSSATAPE